MDRRVGRVGGIEEFEELDELPAAVAILDQGVNRYLRPSPDAYDDPVRTTASAIFARRRFLGRILIALLLGVCSPASADNQYRGLRWLRAARSS